MKTSLLYLLLFAYATAILKPVLPTIADTIAHTFWYAHHMATVHYENGRYHVHLEYADAAKKSSPDKNNTWKEDDSMNIHLFSRYAFECTVLKLAKPQYLLFVCNLPRTYTGTLYPPPKAA